VLPGSGPANAFTLNCAYWLSEQPLPMSTPGTITVRAA
jgi:hypothetical protein